VAALINQIPHFHSPDSPESDLVGWVFIHATGVWAPSRGTDDYE